MRASTTALRRRSAWCAPPRGGRASVDVQTQMCRWAAIRLVTSRFAFACSCRASPCRSGQKCTSELSGRRPSALVFGSSRRMRGNFPRLCANRRVKAARWWQAAAGCPPVCGNIRRAGKGTRRVSSAQSLEAYEFAKEEDGSSVPDALVNRRGRLRPRRLASATMCSACLLGEGAESLFLTPPLPQRQRALLLGRALRRPRRAGAAVRPRLSGVRGAHLRAHP